jgi:hypothetical protein
LAYSRNRVRKGFCGFDMDTLRDAEQLQDVDRAASECSCVICASIKAHGITEGELIHYLAMKASWKLHAARLAVAKSAADMELIKMELKTLELVIGERKVLVDGPDPVQVATDDEAKLCALKK